MRRLLMSWSSGKDSAWALHVLRQEAAVQIVGLVTTTNAAAGRVAMHAVRQSLLERQADALGLPLDIVPLPQPCSNDDYEAAMRHYFAQARARHIDGIAYGDLLLRDVRAYRERLMHGSGLDAVFPLWEQDTAELARLMVGSGLRAYLTCVDPRQMPAHFAGRRFDAAFLDELPQGIDACGENGEFHTFVTQGPMLRHTVDVLRGDVEERDGFVFCDLKQPETRGGDDAQEQAGRFHH